MSSKSIQHKFFRARASRHWSLARRLTLLYAASSFVMLLVVVAYLYSSLVENIERDDSAFLANTIQECRRLLGAERRDQEILAHEIQAEAAASQFIEYYIRVLDAESHLVLETPGMTSVLPVTCFPPPAETSQMPARGTVWKSTVGKSYLLMSAQAQSGATNTAPSILQVAINVSTDALIISSYRWKLIIVVLLGLLFSCLAGTWVARKGLQPLEEITKATESISASQLHERIVPNGWPDELASLAGSFDRMLDRLEDSFKRLSQFSADLAHELRTPINNLRGEAGVALSQPRTDSEYQSTLESALEEYARLSRLIDNLLFLARAEESTANVARTSFDARPAIEALIEFYEALAEDRGIQVVCKGEVKVYADPVLFRQAVSNLLSNALNYTNRGGRVIIEMDALDNRVVGVTVNDTGSGIAPEHISNIFDRFYRVDPARSQFPNGSGLGLAIVKSIMALHGGTVTVQSQTGKGTSFALRFPPEPMLSPAI